MRELAWKPRWARIRLVNSAARSTFDISTRAGTISPRLPSPGDADVDGAGVGGGAEAGARRPFRVPSGSRVRDRDLRDLCCASSSYVAVILLSGPIS